MKPVLFADDESTWPIELVEFLTARRERLTEFLRIDHEIDLAAETDIALRIDRPENPHEDMWDDTLNETQRLIADRKLVGYHCTRLTDDERASIMTEGFHTLSPGLIEQRVRAQVASGNLSAGLAQSILATHQGAAQGRTGMLWFLFHRGTLADKSGVVRLFQSWGGEAVYWSREDGPEGAQLRRLGAPCIVVAAVPVPSIRAFHDPGRRFVFQYLASRGIDVPDDPEWEGNIRHDLAGDDVLRIIPFVDPEFLQLTQSSDWADEIA